MNRLSSLSGAVLLAAAAAVPLPSQAADIVVLNEGFRNVANLSDWAQINRSVPPGTGWFQGNPDVFTAFNGPDNAYIAANYLNAQNGMGVVDNWLITPTLTLNGPSTLSFYTNRSGEPGFFDQLEVRFGFGSNTNADGFDTLLLTIGGDLGFPSDWARWSANLNVQGEGRFAFRYLGDAATLDYVGLDAVRVVTAVPEPSSWLMLLAGLGTVGATARRLRT